MSARMAALTWLCGPDFQHDPSLPTQASQNVNAVVKCSDCGHARSFRLKQHGCLCSRDRTQEPELFVA
jgi:hypothetical protein